MKQRPNQEAGRVCMLILLLPLSWLKVKMSKYWPNDCGHGQNSVANVANINKPTKNLNPLTPPILSGQSCAESKNTGYWPLWPLWPLSTPVGGSREWTNIWPLFLATIRRLLFLDFLHPFFAYASHANGQAFGQRKFGGV